MAESTIVGRDREIGRLRAAIDDLEDGRGSLWFLTGEPGIGKSRLAEEVGRLARERGMRTYWGRCWEAGGAPAYWPWVQVLRAVVRTAQQSRLEPLLPSLVQLLPELHTAQSRIESPAVGPEQARFKLMDAASTLLADAASSLPLVIVLEDLHMADVSTVLLLEFLGATVRHEPLLILGTYRERELDNSAVGPQLLRAAQHGQRLQLDRLSQAETVVAGQRILEAETAVAEDSSMWSIW